MNNFHQTQQEDYKEKSHPHPHLASYPFIPSWSLDTGHQIPEKLANTIIFCIFSWVRFLMRCNPVLIIIIYTFTDLSFPKLEPPAGHNFYFHLGSSSWLIRAQLLSVYLNRRTLGSANLQLLRKLRSEESGNVLEILPRFIDDLSRSNISWS